MEVITDASFFLGLLDDSNPDTAVDAASFFLEDLDGLALIKSLCGGQGLPSLLPPLMYPLSLHLLLLSHPEIPISECEPLSSINSNFQKNFI
jgi:hypothetical protein